MLHHDLSLGVKNSTFDISDFLAPPKPSCAYPLHLMPMSSACLWIPVQPTRPKCVDRKSRGRISCGRVWIILGHLTPCPVLHHSKFPQKCSVSTTFESNPGNWLFIKGKMHAWLSLHMPTLEVLLYLHDHPDLSHCLSGNQSIFGCLSHIVYRSEVHFIRFDWNGMCDVEGKDQS